MSQLEFTKQILLEMKEEQAQKREAERTRSFVNRQKQKAALLQRETNTLLEQRDAHVRAVATK